MKIKGPLMSIEAKGTTGEVLTFSKRKEGQVARFQKKQKDVLTGPRENQRNIFLAAIERWYCRDYGISEFGFSFFGVCPAGLEKKAKVKTMTGYNLFVKEFLLKGEF